jgi:phospholipid/cholesterol/gamma-HCH transport system substrate-binding protein
MNSEKKTEIRVGITIFAALILLALVYGWAKNFSLTSDDKLLQITFPTVAGLEIGDMVSVNGVRKGLVESITTDDNYALVHAKFNEDVNLREDATFSIMMLDLMGGKKIEIKSGNSSKSLDYAKKQKGNFSGDISTAMATLNSVESDLVEVIGELKTSLQSANSIFGNTEFTNNITAALTQIRMLSENINKMVLNNTEVFEQTLVNAKELTEKTNTILDQNSNQITSILGNLDSTLSSSNELISKLAILTDEVVNSENNLGEILYDENLLNDLRSSLKQINELTRTINDQLKSGGLEVKADVDLF